MNNGEFGLLEFLICVFVFLICIILIVIYANKVSRETDILKLNNSNYVYNL